MRLLAVFLATLGSASACFCPPVISSSCGCGGGGGGYAGNYGGNYGYAQPAQPSSYSGSYAVFYRDLTPFRQPQYVQQMPAYPQYYPRQPQQAPPMYQMPSPRYIQAPPPPAPPPPAPRPQYIPRPVQPVRYIQPAATVAPIAEAPRTTLHDNSYGEEQVVVTTPTPTQAPTVDEAPDFVDEVKSEKEEFYYVYYDDKGNKVGDSRSGSTFAPENVIEEVTTVAPSAVHLEVTTQRAEVNENYDDIVEVPVRTSLPASYTPELVTSTSVLFMEPTTEQSVSSATEVVYEDETVEYEDGGAPEEPIPKKATSSGGYKRTVQDNQIMVDAAENTGEGYKGRIAAKGVKIVKRYPKDKRKIHEN